MTESEYSVGFGSAEGDATVAKSWERIVTLGVRGFMAVAGRECWRYHANTGVRGGGQLRVQNKTCKLWQFRSHQEVSM